MLNKAVLIATIGNENFNNLVYKTLVSVGKMPMPNESVYGYYSGLSSKWGQFGEVYELEGKGKVVGFFTFIYGVLFSTVDFGSTLLVVNETTGNKSKFIFNRITEEGEFQYQTMETEPLVFRDFEEGANVKIAVYNLG